MILDIIIKSIVSFLSFLINLLPDFPLDSLSIYNSVSSIFDYLLTYSSFVFFFIPYDPFIRAINIIISFLAFELTFKLANFAYNKLKP